MVAMEMLSAHETPEAHDGAGGGPGFDLATGARPMALWDELRLRSFEVWRTSGVADGLMGHPSTLACGFGSGSGSDMCWMQWKHPQPMLIVRHNGMILMMQFIREDHPVVAAE